jgi:serine protease Do
MNINFSRLIASGLTIAGTSVGLNCLNVLSPIELLNLSQLGSLSSHRVLAQQDQEEVVNIRVYQVASPAVVAIKAGNSIGSGTIISSDGLILTNAHVVIGFKTVKVTLSNGTNLEGDVIAFGEAGLDLAAVKLRQQNNLPTVQIADPNKLAVGQRAFAIGDPFGQFQGTFSKGIVSRINANQGLIQTDAVINPGNSGGPLLNSQAELIGITSAIFSPRGARGNSGIGLAISVDRIKPFLVAVRNGTAPRVAQQAPLLGGGHKAQQIASNSPVEGLLDKNSDIHPSDSSYFNAYTFEGKAGQNVQIEMTSSEVDSYLILLSPDGQDLGHDDDSAGGPNARLTVALPADGIYTVLANTYKAGETGRYSLRLTMRDRSPSGVGSQHKER